MALCLWSAAGCGPSLGPIPAALPVGIAVWKLRTSPPLKYVPVLGKEKEVTTLQLLVRALDDREIKVRAQAVELLGILSRSPDKKLRRKVARVLGNVLRDRDPGIRLQAIETLGRMDDQFANRHLLAALKDPNPFVHKKVLSVLKDREQRKLGQSQAAQAP